MKRRTLFGLAGGTLLAAPNLAQAQRGQRRVLVIASGADVPDLDPHLGTGYAPAAFYRNLYETLVRVEGNPPRVVPMLAESWTASADGMEYVFRLNPAAKFNDGSPVNAEAIRYSFNRALRLGRGNAWMISGALDGNSVTAVDATTVRMKLIRPFAPFLTVLPWIFIVNPTVVEANKGSDDGAGYLRTNVAGSGAFRITRQEVGSIYEFERVANHWRPGGGNLNGAIWRLVRETTTQRLLVQRGEAHMALDLTSEDMDALAGRPGLKLISEPEFRTFSIKMNTRFGPLMDIELRRAISYAFNYQSMLDSAGQARLMVGPLPHGILGHDPNLDVPRTDMAKAREHLARSTQMRPGLKLKVVHVVGLEQQRRWSLVMLDSLRQLGIDLDVQAMPWPDMVASARSPETTADFFMVYQTANYADPDNIAFAAYHSSRNGGWQNPVYRNPEVDALIERGRSETNEATRIAIYREMQQKVVADAPDIFGVLETRKLAFRDNVDGFVFTPVASNAIEFANLNLR
ncbi:ABC transporter substrate-binding protein [Falsiroseomonas sp. HW251]|uniref:ABC transporter substrate-binding protein n=1 Tax=Falsiroseomonas sp. HW251 TaxID=3390998 RepID=UPI003D31073B